MKQECSSPVAPIVACSAGATAGGHRPWFAFIRGTRVPVVCCVLCGSYTEANSNVIGLVRACPVRAGNLGGRARPSKGAQCRLGRFLRGLHPIRDVALGGPFKELPSVALWRPGEAWAFWRPEDSSHAAVSGRPANSHLDDDEGSVVWECDPPIDPDEPWPEGPVG